MQSLFEQEGQRRDHPGYTVRNNVLGHLQQGNSPSPLDRVMAAKLGTAAVDFCTRHMARSGPITAEDYCVLGLHADAQVVTPVENLIANTDFKHRRPREQWFEELQPLLRILEMNSEGNWGDDVDYLSCCTVVPLEPLPEEGS